jgi:hypothetical protein
MSWKSPNSSSGNWTSMANAYDESTDSYTYKLTAAGTWSSLIELQVPVLVCDKIRFFTSSSLTYFTLINIDVYYNGDWHLVYEGTFIINEWIEKIVPNGPSVVSKARIKFYNNGASASMARLNEFDFNQFAARPLVDGSLASGNPLIRKGLAR